MKKKDEEFWKNLREKCEGLERRMGRMTKM